MDSTEFGDNGELRRVDISRLKQVKNGSTRKFPCSEDTLLLRPWAMRMAAETIASERYWSKRKGKN